MYLSLERDEISEIERLILKLENSFLSVESECFMEECFLESAFLPKSLRKKLYNFRNQKEENGFFVLRGFQINDDKIGNTPQHWDTPWSNKKNLREEIFQSLVSSSLGDTFGWKTQENGRILRNIVPTKSDSDEQLGGSSSVPLLWHVEEAFHPCKADMMTIMCYRNDERAGTNLCSLNQMKIPQNYMDILRQSRFYIEPDKSHFPENNNSQHWELQSEDFCKIKSFLLDPKPVPVIWGPQGSERFVIDQAFMKTKKDDLEAQEALGWLHHHMDEMKRTVVMDPGDVLFLDNRRVAHGRTVYKPNFGPKARWLRRINITTDLTKSFEWKKSPYDRKIL